MDNRNKDFIEKYTIILVHFNSIKRAKKTFLNKVYSLFNITPRTRDIDIINIEKFYYKLFKILQSYTNEELNQILLDDASGYNNNTIINNLKKKLSEEYPITYDNDHWSSIINIILTEVPCLNKKSSKLVLVEQLLKLIFNFEYNEFNDIVMSVAHSFDLVTNVTVKRLSIINTSKRYVMLKDVDIAIDYFLKYNLLEIVDRDDCNTIYYKIVDKPLIHQYGEGYKYWDMGGLIPTL